MLDVSGIKKEQEAAKSGKGFKFKEGKNYIRVFLFDHKVTEADVKAGASIESNIGKVVQKPGRALTIQFDGTGGRPILSNPGSMKKFEALESSSDADDRKASQKIKPQKKFACFFVDTSVKPSKIRCELLPMSFGAAVWDKATDTEHGEKTFGCSGRDFVVKYDPKAKSPQDYYKIELRDRENCRVLPSQLTKEVKDLYGAGWEKLLGLTPKITAAPVAEVDEAEESSVEEEESTETEGTEAEETIEKATEDAAETSEAEETSEEEVEEAEEAEEAEEEPEEAPEPPAKPAKKAVKKPIPAKGKKK